VNDAILTNTPVNCQRCSAVESIDDVSLLSAQAMPDGSVGFERGKVRLCAVCKALPGRVLSEWYSGLMSRAEVT
jgi:hypothetical protein